IPARGGCTRQYGALDIQARQVVTIGTGQNQVVLEHVEVTRSLEILALLQAEVVVVRLAEVGDEAGLDGLANAVLWVVHHARNFRVVVPDTGRTVSEVP